MEGFIWTGSTGKVVPLASATVPFGTPGVMFGESVFETLRVRRGTVFQFDRHRERLQGAIRALGWGTPPTQEHMNSGLEAVVRACQHEASAHRASVPGTAGQTEGAEPRAQAAEDLRIRMTVLRLDDGDDLELVIQAVPYTPPAPARYTVGVSGIIASVRLDGDAPVYRYKTGNRILFRQAGAEARRQEAWEGLVLNSDGMLADGSVSNVHIVEKGHVFAPSVGCGALPGIAQGVLRECARAIDIPWTWEALAPSRLARAEEAFLTNALIGILPLVRVDGIPVGPGKPGPITKRLQEAYAARVAAESRPIGGHSL